MNTIRMEMEKRNFIVHPHKFNMWLFIISLIMVFGGLTSAYIVSRSMVKQPEFFELPDILWNNTLVIVFSSVTMQFAVWAVKRNQHKKALAGLILTFILGVIFLLGQLQAFDDMVLAGNFLVDRFREDDSVSYFYVFTGLHGAHIVAGVLALLVVLIRSLLNNFAPGRKVLTYEITATFWHFLDLLWVYLFVFLLFTQK